MKREDQKYCLKKYSMINTWLFSMTSEDHIFIQYMAGTCGSDLNFNPGLKY